LLYEPYAGRWAVRLRTDFYNHGHPCGAGTWWTWLSLIDHAWVGGGPLPTADRLKVQLRGVYNEVTGNKLTELGHLSGLSRAGVTWTGVWGGRTIMVDLNLYQNLAWGDAHPDPDVVYVVDSPAVAYVVLHGAAMQPAIAMLRNSDASLVIPFDAIIRNLITRGLLPSPAIGEALTTTTVGPFIEDNTLVSDGQSVISDWLLYSFGVIQ